ncbi:MAG TPA: MBL fold metallo-hydrolase [Steroidobacteraceae bacterium]|nr:MBL fold metallo-hydrolase [Steroidobacteraceae bacterium]
MNLSATLPIPYIAPMHENANDPADAPAALTYPLGSAPPPGQALAVAQGVMWLRMPLPVAGLNHINVWALEDGAGWTLIDTGMQTADTTTHWQSAFADALQRRPVMRVICTHMHPDHIGMAGWLTRHYDCRLWTTRLEYVTCRMLVADTGREAPLDGLRFYRAAGWDEDALEHYRARFGGFGKAVYTLPDSYRRVVDAEQLAIGGRTWHAVVGRGHSPEHLCLHCPELAVLISGDQVLPRITSNVSVFPTEPDANPLAEWLESLAAIQERVPDDVLVLPSHNEPFRGLHARLTALITGHERRLARLQELLAAPKRAVDLFGVLFRRGVSLDMLGMATGESIAHLNCLIGRNLAARELDAAGVAWYRRR